MAAGVYVYSGTVKRTPFAHGKTKAIKKQLVFSALVSGGRISDWSWIMPIVVLKGPCPSSFELPQ